MMALLLALVNWVALLPAVTPAVPRLEIAHAQGTGTCSAVVFEIDKDGFANALTAAHCVEKSSETQRLDITVNGRTAVVLHQNRLLDLAIVRFRARDEVAMVLAKDNPLQGSEIAVLGFAFGEEEIVVQFGHIAQKFNKPTRTTWVDSTLIFGDSGGALINDQGELVGINSAIKYQGPARIGMVVPVTAILDYIDAFQAMKVKK